MNTSRFTSKYSDMFDFDIPFRECKREFDLPLKFPSMINVSEYKSMHKDYKTVTIINPQICSKPNGSEIKKMTMNDIKKLRIRTKDGKDLGEIKVKFLARENVLNSSKIVYANKNTHKSFNNTRETVESENNNLVLLNKRKNENVLIRNKCTFSSREKDGINENTSIAKETEIPKETNVSNKNSNTQLAKSKFPIVMCEKLLVPKTKINKNEITTSPIKMNKKKRYLNSNTSPKKVIKLNNNAFSSNITESNKHTGNILKKKTNSTQIKLNNESEVEIICEKPAIVDQCFNNAQDNNKNINNLDTCKNEIICNNKDIQNKDFIGWNNNITKKTKIIHNTGKENFSDCFSVIKEALISVKDEQLRAKAFHALAECGIGIAKQVPITPPDKLKTVHDSQVQTDVFGLLDFETFILIKSNTCALERIKQREYSLPLMKEIQIQTELQMLPEIKQNNYINNIDLLPMWDSVPLPDTINLHNFLNENLNDNTNINRVKEVLSIPHSLCKKMAVQLERDYEEMQHCDDNGLLNIHRAVIDDEPHIVQRLLVVLKASKTDIDVLTDNGMTSLELAIKFGVSRDIINLLLEAGAKPVSSELLHESAVMLASKSSSPFLVDLLNYVTEPKLLNNMDSSGMAPLHYCAINGYLDGVNALINVGADVNLQDNRSGRTPFFHALENKQVPVAKKLLQYHAIPELPNYSGQSVLQLIDEAKSFSLKGVLQEVAI